MKQNPSDPDLATLLGRINRGDLDLQPEFQRQEIWNDAKKKRLIDTILRDWHVPPIHLVENPESGRHEVLDGQQRLAAIRDFADNKLTVDGKIAPISQELMSLDGLWYRNLPDKYRRKFDRYPLRVITITEYAPEEPGELFFRLNQQSLVTAPEQRNAFFGPTRDQVRSLVRMAQEAGFGLSTVGFSNSRMAFDDAIARFCQTLENGTLRTKITAADITDRYRSGNMFTDGTLSRARESILAFCLALRSNHEAIRLNKATLHSWLCFTAETIADFGEISTVNLGSLMSHFEGVRAAMRAGGPEFSKYNEQDAPTAGPTIHNALRLFNDRAASRVADVSSVLSRDFVLWSVHERLLDERRLAPPKSSERTHLLKTLIPLLKPSDLPDENLERIAQAIEASDWGRSL